MRRLTMKHTHILCTAILVLLSVKADAQSREPRVNARFIPDSILIGDQFELQVTVTKDIMQDVAFPEFQGNLGEYIEILQEGDVDTLVRDGRNHTLEKKYKLTTFDDGFYSIGKFPMLYSDKNVIDTIWSRDSLILKVATFEIDTLTQTIHDVKRPLEAPVKFGEYSGWLAIAFAALLIIALVIWQIVRRRRNLTIFGKPKPVDPPHLAAIKSLEILYNQKLWQNNRHKQYYTGITDILRTYLDGRFGIHAMEMTSDEIMTAVRDASLSEKNMNDLDSVLRLADLVKFAAFIPDPESNENAYTTAYYFVEDTKPQEVEEAQLLEDREI